MWLEKWNMVINYYSEGNESIKNISLFKLKYSSVQNYRLIDKILVWSRNHFLLHICSEWNFWEFMQSHVLSLTMQLESLIRSSKYDKTK